MHAISGIRTTGPGIFSIGIGSAFNFMDRIKREQKITSKERKNEKKN
jgi:hypothetical protein